MMCCTKAKKRTKTLRIRPTVTMSLQEKFVMR